MAAKSNLKNMALCLTAVCLICAALLGCVYAITYEPIQAASQKALVASIAQVLPEGGEISEMQEKEGYQYYTQTVDGKPVAYAVKSATNGFGGALTLMVGVLADGTVYNTSVLSHSETPGLGAKCQDSASAFRKQFQGFPADKSLVVKKDGGDVDAITASTITSRAFTLAVSNAVNVVKLINGEYLAADAFSGASKKNEGGQTNE